MEDRYGAQTSQGGHAPVPRLLIVHHTASPATQTLLDAVVDGASDEALRDVDVVLRPALTAAEVDVLEADGFVLGTPANIGYMSGALKHFFDRIYYPCLASTRGRPYGLYVHGNDDTTGAVRSVETIAKSLGWDRVSLPVSVVGSPTGDDRDACRELGATVAAVVLDRV
jgi:multimeric flavodoxin WrbA